MLLLGQLHVGRYSGGQLVAHLTLFGRGIYFSRAADGSWLRLVVREPRRPPGHDPKSGTAELAPPEA